MLHLMQTTHDRWYIYTWSSQEASYLSIISENQKLFYRGTMINRRLDSCFFESCRKAENCWTEQRRLQEKWWSAAQIQFEGLQPERLAVLLDQMCSFSVIICRASSRMSMVCWILSCGATGRAGASSSSEHLTTSKKWRQWIRGATDAVDLLLGLHRY